MENPVVGTIEVSENLGRKTTLTPRALRQDGHDYFHCRKHLYNLV